MKVQRRLVVLTVSCLLALLCNVSAFAQAAEPGKAPAADEALQKAIHDYILAHPEVLIQSLQIAREREQIRQEAQSKNLITSLKKDLADDPMTPVRGNWRRDGGRILRLPLSVLPPSRAMAADADKEQC